jgi:hypothetical protein
MPRTAPLGCAVTMMLILASAGCASARPISAPTPAALSCVSPMEPHLRTSVHFDRSNTLEPQHPYSASEWERFIKEVLIRFLPAGGSIYENTGWWRRPNGTTFRGIGRTLVVWAALPDSTPHRAGVDSVIAHIKQQYRHRVVFREEERVCEGAF